MNKDLIGNYVNYIKYIVKDENDLYLDQIKQLNSFYDNYFKIVDRSCGLNEIFEDLNSETLEFLHLCDIMEIQCPNYKSSIFEKSERIINKIHRSSRDTKELVSLKEKLTDLHEGFSNINNSFKKKKELIDHNIDDTKQILKRNMERHLAITLSARQKEQSMIDELRKSGFPDEFSLETLSDIDEEIEHCTSIISELMENLNEFQDLPNNLSDLQMMVKKKEDELQDLSKNTVKKLNLAEWK